jgi:hypothetical protein
MSRKNLLKNQAFPQYNIVQNDTIIFNGFFDILDIFERKYLK